MDSSKISLKEGFDFLFENEDKSKKADKKIKLIYDASIPVTKDNAILYALSFDIFEAIVNKEEKTSLQKAKSVGDRGKDESNIYHGTGVYLKYFLDPAKSNLTKPSKYVNLMQDEDSDLGASSTGHVKNYLENVKAAFEILQGLGAQKIQLEAKKVKKFIAKVNKAAYDRLVLRIMSGNEKSILSTSGKTVNFKIDALHKKLEQNIDQLVKTTTVKTKKGELSKRAQAKIDKAQKEFKGVQRSADIFEAWVKLLRRGDDPMYQVKQSTLEKIRKISDPVKKKKKMKQIQNNFNKAVFRGVKNRPKMLDAIRQNKFDFIVYVLAGAGFQKESKNKDPNKQYGSRLQDRAFIKLFEMLYEKSISDDIMQEILTVVNNFYKSEKNIPAGEISGTSEYRKIKRLLRQASATPTGVNQEEIQEEEQEQHAQQTGVIIEPLALPGQDTDTQSEELSGDETTSSSEDESAEPGDDEASSQEDTKADTEEETSQQKPDSEAEEAGEEPVDKSNDLRLEDEVDHIIFDSFYGNPIINGISVIALNLKYDSSFNIPAISDYNKFKKISLESLKYLCNNGHLKDNADENITYLTAARHFTAISATFNSEYGKFILAENVSQNSKQNIKIFKSSLNTFVSKITSDNNTMLNICHFLESYHHFDKVYENYVNHDKMGTISTTFSLEKIIAKTNSGEATLDFDNAQLSNEDTTAVIPVVMGDNKTVVRVEYNDLDSEVELTAANGDSVTIPLAPKMSDVSGADTIVTQLIAGTEFDATLSDESQVDVQDQRDSYEESYQNKDNIIESIISSKEFNNIRANFVSGESKTSFESNLEEVLTGDIIDNIKRGKDIAKIQVPLSKMMMNYQISTGPIKSIMKNILKKDEDDLRAIVKLSMFGSTKKLYQDQFDLQLSNVVRAAFEQNVYGNTSFEVSESLLREGFLTGIKNLSSDLAQGLKNLWAGKDSVEKWKMATALGGLAATGFSAAPVAAGLYTVSAALGLGRRFAKEVPEEKAARKDWFPEGQSILKMILEDKESDKFIATLVKTNIINTIIKLINPEYNFKSTAADPKKLQPVVEEFLEQKETYQELNAEQKSLFKDYSKRVHNEISVLPWADYGGNSQHGEFAIVSPMHINRLINKLFLTENGIKFLNYTTYQAGHKEENTKFEKEIHTKLRKYLDEINIPEIYASRLRQVVKKRSSLVKGNISNWFKDRVSPKWKTTVYAEFSSKIVKDVLNVEQSFMPKKSASLKDKVGAYASSLGKERSDENYLGYSLEELLFENIIFENSNIFLNEEEKVKTREEIDDESVRDTESTAEDLLTGISPTLEFLTMQLEKENLYQSLVVRDFLPYTTTELKTQMTQARDYVDTAQEAVKLQSSMPKQDFVNRWYELEPNDAGEGQEIISWWYSTKKYAGTPKQLHLAYRNTTTGEIKMIGGAEEAEEFGWTEVLKENGLKIDGTNGIQELPDCDAKLVDLNDDSVISEFMTDLKSNFVGSYHEQILKTSEPMTVEEYIDKTQEKFTGSESGLHLALPNDKSPDMLEKIALTSAKNEQFMLMKIKAGIKAGKLTGEVPPGLLSGTKKGLVEFNLSEKMLEKAGINDKTLDKFEEYRYRLEQARIDYMQSEGEGPVSLERMYVQAYRETVGTLPVEQKEELVSAIVKVKGEAANAGLNLAVNNVSHEEVVEIEVTKYKEIEREIQIPLDKSSELGRTLEKFYNFSSILRTANMVTSIGTLLWKRGIDHALFQKHFMENIRLDDAIISDIFSVIMGYSPIFTNRSTTHNGQSIVSDKYENPATPDVQSAAEDVLTADVRENNLVYETDLSSYLFENKLVTKSRKSSKISNNNVSYSEEINEHNELKDLFKKLF